MIDQDYVNELELRIQEQAIEVEELQREWRECEALLAGSQRDNENKHGSIERMKAYIKSIEQLLVSVCGPNWQQDHSIAPLQLSNTAISTSTPLPKPSFTHLSTSTSTPLMSQTGTRSASLRMSSSVTTSAISSATKARRASMIKSGQRSSIVASASVSVQTRVGRLSALREVGEAEMNASTSCVTDSDKGLEGVDGAEEGAGDLTLKRDTEEQDDTPTAGIRALKSAQLHPTSLRKPSRIPIPTRSRTPLSTGTARPLPTLGNPSPSLHPARPTSAPSSISSPARTASAADTDRSITPDTSKTSVSPSSLAVPIEPKEAEIGRQTADATPRSQESAIPNDHISAALLTYLQQAEKRMQAQLKKLDQDLEELRREQHRTPTRLTPLSGAPDPSSTIGRGLKPAEAQSGSSRIPEPRPITAVASKKSAMRPSVARTTSGLPSSASTAAVGSRLTRQKGLNAAPIKARTRIGASSGVLG